MQDNSTPRVGSVATESHPGTGSPLAHCFAGNDGGAYYVSEVGNKVYWFAEHPGRDYAHVFHGTRDHGTIKGQFYSVPKDRATTHGQATFKIHSNGALERISESGGFPSKSLGVVAMSSIVDKLPRKRKWPGFTANTPGDLDGVFDDGRGHRCYLRQMGDHVVFFAEKDFDKGERPDQALVFVGDRKGNSVEGTWIGVPKGKQTGSGALALSLKPGRVLVSAAGSPFGAGLFNPVLPDIPIPIKTVMDLANSQLNKVKIHLDGYAGGKHTLKDGSYVKLGKESFHFTIPGHDGKATRYFIDNMDSDIIHVTPISEDEARFSVVFEDKGREIKRVAKVGGDDLAKDWDIEHPRCDIYFRLANHETSDGRSSISYEVEKVELLAELDAPLLTEGIDDWITDKVRPVIESEIKKALNQRGFRQLVADEIQQKLDDLVKAASEYQLFGYSIAALVPKQVSISGHSVVFSFI